MFAERFRIRRNWLKGFCNVRTFEGHTQGTLATAGVIVLSGEGKFIGICTLLENVKL